MEKIKEFLKKDIYKKIKVWHLLIAFIVIGVSVGGGEEEEQDSVKKVHTENIIESDWNHKKSQNMGGYNISIETELNIVSIEKDNKDKLIKYRIKQTIIDEYSGSVPKFEYEEGSLKHNNKNKLEFKEGDFEERGAYIIIPEDRWENKPKTILIKFEENQGNDMLFNRN